MNELCKSLRFSTSVHLLLAAWICVLVRLFAYCQGWAGSCERHRHAYIRAALGKSHAPSGMFWRQVFRRLTINAAERMATGSVLQRDWDLAVNAVELMDGPLYFCSEKVLSDPTTRDAVKPHKEGLAETFRRRFPSTVSFAFTAYNPGDVSQSDVKNAIDYDKLVKDLDKRIPPTSTVQRSYSFFPDDSSHFERGLSLFISDNPEVVKLARKFVSDLCLEYGQAGYFEYNERDGKVYQNLVAVPSQKVEAVSPLVRVDIPPCHPVFAQPNCHSVFQCITKLQQVLSEMKVSHKESCPRSVMDHLQEYKFCIKL